MKKGFTLIELIAVIVILAIITLIAIPVITGIVDKSKKGAAEVSALNYIDAVEKYNMLHDVNPTKYPYNLKDNTFNVSSNTEISLLDIIIPKAKAEGSIPSLNSFITVKGDKPKSGTVTIDKKGKVTEADLVFGKYYTECVSDKCVASKERTSVVINSDDTITMVVGDTIKLNAATNSDKPITWTSSDDSVVIVSNGTITAKKVGTAKIKAKVEKAEAIVNVNVENLSLSIDGNKPRNASKGTNLELSVTTNSSSNITWTSSDNTIATVENGIVSPLKFGSVTITASIGDVSDSIDLNILSGATKEAAPAGATYKGIVYLNPKNLSDHCTSSNSYSNTERKDGCMKWYIFDDSTSKYKMILDHNSTARIKWEAKNKNVPYQNSNLPSVVNSYGWDSSIGTRLITAYEINTIIGTSSVWNVANYNTRVFLDTKTNSRASFNSTNRSRFFWLFDYTRDCYNNGCKVQDNNTYTSVSGSAYNGQTEGYWTSTPVQNTDSMIWIIYCNGDLANDGYYGRYAYGIRPVIEVDKNIIQ